MIRISKSPPFQFRLRLRLLIRMEYQVKNHDVDLLQLLSIIDFIKDSMADTSVKLQIQTDSLSPYLVQEQQHYYYYLRDMPEVEHLRIQNDEFTALANIYLDEFTVLKQTAPYKFNVLCKPYTDNQFDYQINLMFEHTKQYPASSIKYQIQPIAGITRDNINHITKKIEEIIANSNHKPVVFDIVEETRDWINVYLVEGKLDQIDQINLYKKVEVFERPKFAAFTPVTVENFVAWKKDFDLRHRNDKAAKKETEIKLTGKQWFLGKHEQIQSSSEEQEDEEEEIEEGQQIVDREVQNELFKNE